MFIRSVLLGTCLAHFSLIATAEFPSNVLITISLNASKYEPVKCADPLAKGPMTGLYLQETGGKICLLDYGDIVVLPRTTGLWGLFEARFERHDEGQPEISGVAYANGYSSGSIITPCYFQGFSKLKPLSGGHILWTKPTFRYDNSCCNLLHQIPEQDLLIKTEE